MMLWDLLYVQLHILHFKGLSSAVPKDLFAERPWDYKKKNFLVRDVCQEIWLITCFYITNLISRPSSKCVSFRKMLLL